MATVEKTKEKKIIDEAAEVKIKPTKSAAKKKTTKTPDEKSKAGAKAVKKKTSPKTAKKTASKKSSSKESGKQKFKQYEGKILVVVESPAKAKTLEKILGNSYKVLASVGHVRDLPKGRIAIDVENDFEPDYIQVRGKAELIRGLKGASKVSSRTLLASDPDREGEAIAWHLATLLEIDPKSECRIRMQEITEHGVTDAVKEPDSIDIDKVDAQQARRVLDRLVGYQLSPLLWNKVKRGLSAGRVQSVALRIICEREDEIDKFVSEEYWLIDVEGSSTDGKRKYKLRADKFKGKPFTVHNEKEAAQVEDEINKSDLKVEEFKTKENPKSALPPFKTSTLQQEASRRCGFAPGRTMRVAQSLYEGVDIPGRGPVGLITYMRTDSLRISPDAVESSQKFILDNYGKKYLPKDLNTYTSKARSQDAHEAIRATDASITPESIKSCLTPEQYRLYELIWGRFIASQMAPAIIARTTLTCVSGDYSLKQAGVVVVFDGWGKVYPLGVKDAEMKPAIEGETLLIDNIIKDQRFTQPPSRYTEAGLVKALEEKGIGRPSTYAAIINTLSVRNYVDRGEEDKKLIPSKLGRLVNTFIVKHFSSLINVDFTAMMEDELDQIENGELQWRKVVGEFWKGFKPVLDDVSEHAESMRPEPELVGEPCPECGKDLLVKSGRFGEFIACSGYPECKYTRNIVRTTGIKCPKCGEGELVRRRASKGKVKGRMFYGCTRYPECDFISWKKPEKTNQEETVPEPAENVNVDTDV
ncbi:MAG: type I DNA topoisomerase [Synergistaceae bacterium]|nr:type I DNA topoisomerase [Synergistaceae bacterium]